MNLTKTTNTGYALPTVTQLTVGIGVPNIAAQPQTCGFFVPKFPVMTDWVKHSQEWLVAMPVRQLRSVCLQVIGVVWGQVFNLFSGIAIMSNIKHLPFVADLGKGKNKHRTFWHVTPNGNYGDECIIGEAYARKAIEYMESENLSCLLGWVVLAIQEKPNHSGIEIGFMSVIAQYAVLGVQKERGASHA